MYRLHASLLQRASASTTARTTAAFLCFAKSSSRSRLALLPPSAVSSTLCPSSSSSFQRNFSSRDGGGYYEGGDGRSVTTGGITVGRKSKSARTGYCYGCGADLVKGEAGSMGTVVKSSSFWASRADDVKKGKIKNWSLCPRCKQLRKMEETGGVTKQAVSLGPDSKMTEVFRQEVSKIRKKEKAVVVMCVDSININGTLLSTIRKYVGGNPILLAVTRCDLLPDYVWEDKDPESIKEVFRERAKAISPAAIYLCSEAKGVMQQIGGIKDLALDLWEHLNGRDPYVIGCANLGKSTLTDILISGFINKGDQLQHFSDKLSRKRLEKLKETRITKSALPGTTLQNVRVPCFQDHQQALWDTPGLLVDTGLKQFPIRNFRTIRAQRPKQIQPHIYVEEERKSLALTVAEKDDEFPLLRFEIRLKKSAEGDGPIRLVWNSTMNFDTKILDINVAREEENNRWPKIKQKIEEERAEIAEKQRQSQEESANFSEEERALRKEEKRQAYLNKVREEKMEMGAEAYYQREQERVAAKEEDRRSRILAQLSEVHSCVIEKGTGVDLAVANTGWLGILMPRTAMIKVFAPNTGVRITNHDAMALPPDWGEYLTSAQSAKAAKKERASKPEGGKDDDDDSLEVGSDDEIDDFGDDDDIELGDYGEYDFGDEYTGLQDEFGSIGGEEEFGFDRGHGGDDDSDDDYDEDGDYDYGGHIDEDSPYGGPSRGDYRDRPPRGDGEKMSYRERFIQERIDQDQRAKSSYRMYRKKEAAPEDRDHWEKFSGKYVGWQFDEDTRWMTGPKRLEEGWNPLRKSEKDEEEKEKEAPNREKKPKKEKKQRMIL